MNANKNDNNNYNNSDNNINSPLVKMTQAHVDWSVCDRAKRTLITIHLPENLQVIKNKNLTTL